MKHYNYIFYPDSNSNGEWTVQGMDLENECVERSPGPVIVLTANELWDMWAECAADQVDAETRLKNIEMFNRYLTSKGINITENG